MTAGAPRTVRVTVTDAWDTVRLEVPADQSVRALKTRALGQALTRADVDMYQVKFRGGVVLDESRTLDQLGVPDGAPLIVLPVRRRPVR